MGEQQQHLQSWEEPACIAAQSASVVSHECLGAVGACRLEARLQGLEEKLAALDEGSRVLLAQSAAGWLGELQGSGEGAEEGGQGPAGSGGSGGGGPAGA